MPTYATRADFEAYVEGWTTTDGAALDRLLERAERDVDSVLNPFLAPDPVTGLKIAPAQLLSDAERDALARATCAQAEHRHRHPDAFTGAAKRTKIAGPDFTVDYDPASNPGRYAPALLVELAPLARLRLRTARARP